MLQFLVLFREPDGRKDPHTPEEMTAHRKNWNRWSEQMNKEHRIAGGMPLTLAGKVLGRAEELVTQGLRGSGPIQTATEGSHRNGHIHTVTDGPHRVGDEIIGGYLLINAGSLDEAASLMQDCPIFEFGGYAEIREGMSLPATAGPSTSGPEPSSPAKLSSTDISLQEQNKAIVRRFNKAFIQDGDIAAFHDIIDPSVINHTAPAGFSNGADGMLAVIDIFRKALTGIEVRIHRQVAEDDIVVTHKSFHATHTGTLMGTPPSGQPIVITIIDIVRLHNGRYVEHWGIRDSFRAPAPSSK